MSVVREVIKYVPKTGIDQEKDERGPVLPCRIAKPVEQTLEGSADGAQRRLK